MKTLKERIEIEQHFANGGKILIRWSALHTSEWKELSTKCRDKYVFDWSYYYYEKALRTFTIAGKEYPAALTEIPDDGTVAWFVHSLGVMKLIWDGTQGWQREGIRNGFIFATKEDAEASIEALAKLRRGEL